MLETRGNKWKKSSAVKKMTSKRISPDLILIYIWPLLHSSFVPVSSQRRTPVTCPLSGYKGLHDMSG